MDTIKKTKTQVVAVSYDPVETLQKFGEKSEIEFLLLSDPGSKTIDAYGIRNKDVEAGSRLDGIPHPGTFVIGKDGVIRAKLSRSGYRERHTPEELIEAVNRFDK